MLFNSKKNLEKLKKQMKLITVIIFSLLSFVSYGQKSGTLEEPKVDERVEILSIVFRLAESKEYNSEIFKLYTDKIQKYYNSFKNHELIQFIKKMRKENGVGYDAVMTMAIHLDEQLDPLIEFTNEVPDTRWGKENSYKFVSLLKKFYQDSDSKKFFEQNKKLYEEVNNRFLPIYKDLDINWYKSFYGKEPNEEFLIVNGLGNGGGNYSSSINFSSNKRKVYAIMGTWKTDSTGMAIFPIENYFPTLLHEFNHSFINYLLDENPKPFQESGITIFNEVKDKMNNGGYNDWQTMLNEALVRASVVKYMKDHNFGKDQISLEVSEQISRGFIWIEELVEELEKYSSNRDEYPTLKSYMPNLIKAYKEYAKNLNYYVDRNEDLKARFVSISEFENGSQTVDPSLKKLTINFDKPFQGVQFIRPGKNMKAFPKITGLTYSTDNKSAILNVSLESEKEYKFYLIGLAPKSNNENVSTDYEISFKTFK